MNVSEKTHSHNIDGQIIERLRKCGTEFVLATLKEIQLATLTVLPFVPTL
jgi:hypothetical protein